MFKGHIRRDCPCDPLKMMSISVYCQTIQQSSMMRLCRSKNRTNKSKSKEQGILILMKFWQEMSQTFRESAECQLRSPFYVSCQPLASKSAAK